MINIKDFKSYFLQNYEFIELLRENNSLVYDRLQDLFKILGFIELMVDENKEVEEELEVIFEVGFSYLHEQLEEIKLYYNNYFNGDFLIFKKYEKFINYILYLNDLVEVLKEKAIFTDLTKKVIDDIYNGIESILTNKSKIDEKVIDKYNALLEQNVPVGTHTTLEIYGMIIEELAI